MNESVILSATKWSRRISLALVLAFLAACEEGTGELTWPDEFSAEPSSSYIQPESSSSIVAISSLGTSQLHSYKGFDEDENGTTLLDEIMLMLLEEMATILLEDSGWI